MILGAILIVDALTERFEIVPFVIGLLMVGLVPADAVIDATMGAKSDADLEQRLKQALEERDKN